VQPIDQRLLQHPEKTIRISLDAIRRQQNRQLDTFNDIH